MLNIDDLFKGRHFDREIIVLCVRWYLRYKLGFRDLVEMMGERGHSLAHTTIMRWIQRYVPEFEKRWNRVAHLAGRSWRVDETLRQNQRSLDLSLLLSTARSTKRERRWTSCCASSETSPPPKPSSEGLSGARGDCRIKSPSTVIRPQIAPPKRPSTNMPREINAGSDPQNI